MELSNRKLLSNLDESDYINMINKLMIIDLIFKTIFSTVTNVR